MAESSMGTDVLVELESRQDEVLRQLEDLHQRVERTLADFLAIRQRTEPRSEEHTSELQSPY